MLVLTRKIQEKITIGGNITLTVLRVKGQTVRIGIEAPREIRVVRGELPAETSGDQAAELALSTASDRTAAPSAAKKVRSVGRKTTDPQVENSTAASNHSRLPQRRKTDRYSQPPLRLVNVTSSVLAK